jgi:hypothetical protein
LDLDNKLTIYLRCVSIMNGLKIVSLGSSKGRRENEFLKTPYILGVVPCALFVVLIFQIAACKYNVGVPLLLRESIHTPPTINLRQDCIDVFNVLGECFAKYIRDTDNILGKCGKHAVLFLEISANFRCTHFWFNLMSMMIARDRVRTRQIFPVGILRSLLPMVVAGLKSTQIRTRQDTYRFLVGGNNLSAIFQLETKESIKLVKAIELARKEFEADSFDRNESRGSGTPLLDGGSICRGRTAATSECIYAHSHSPHG